VQRRGYKKAQRRQIKMELLTVDRPHHFVRERVRSFRPCQASRLPRSTTIRSQSIASLYSICKGILSLSHRLPLSWGDNRRCGSTFAATPDKASGGFFMMVMSPWAHVAAVDADGPPFVVHRAACARWRQCRGGNSEMTRSRMTAAPDRLTHLVSSARLDSWT
jgi:hypothetical protein